MKKSLVTILMIAVIFASLIVPLLSTVQANRSDDYRTVNGVLDTDHYTLYPFDTSKSLKIGFSRFGEMINSEENVGLEYGAVDPFAPPAGAAIGSKAKKDWLNGWLCNITYYNRLRDQNRNVWASAQHGDPSGDTLDDDWIRVDFPNDHDATYGDEDPRDPGFIIGGMHYGGRKTNGTAVTQPIQVLYDGPRSFAALLKTTIYDHFVYQSGDTTDDIPLLEVRFTIMFNKVKKEVVVLKELKTLVSSSVTYGLNVQFSNRGEVALGTESTGNESFFHFYTQGTSRGINWTGTGKNYENNDTLAEGLFTVYDRNWVLDQTEDPIWSVNANYSAAGPYPQSFGATYDAAVAINPTENYTWWAAFWPSLSDWSIDGEDMWFRSMSANDPHDIDGRTWATPPTTEPAIPYYIGEWDVVLEPVGSPIQQQYRFVTIYGITDLNDANDSNMNRGMNIIDRETMYQLDEYFNPWDLNSAVHKDTRRWVEFKTTSATSYTTTKKPVLVVPWESWDSYGVSSERVIRLDTGKLLNRTEGEYNIVQNDNGTATLSNLPTAQCKILYSTLPEWYELNVVDLPSEELTFSGVNPGGSVSFTYSNFTQFSADPLGVIHGFLFDVEMEIAVQTSVRGDFSADYDDPSMSGISGSFKVDKENPYFTVPIYWDNMTFASTNTIITCVSPTFLEWFIASPEETLQMDIIYAQLVLASHVSYNFIERELNVTFVPYVGYEYAEYMGGRYEWATVGRDAASVDSAGAARVTAAFERKQVATSKSGADMYNPAVTLQMPWVMAKMSTGDTRASYYYSGTDYRTALKDDWCTTLPVASSNMIGVGGAFANLLAWYGNDFTDAFFGIGDFTDYAAWENKIVPKTCWNHAQAYTSNDTVGYAVISTYKDINGTVLFLIWGHWGRDTYYVTEWFHDEGIYQLQEAPSGMTSIIVQITYANSAEGYKPTAYSIVECLGTISETLWRHYSDDTYEDNGGIHDP